MKLEKNIIIIFGIIILMSGILMGSLFRQREIQRMYDKGFDVAMRERIYIITPDTNIYWVLQRKNIKKGGCDE
ncbi:MAG: hypothetical protein RBQ78_05000 [Acholeplasmataceae bacterium]|jgi:hypothetical protein|nr:hypothetical protein [Acholeplasmataceae bacterium]